MANPPPSHNERPKRKEVVREVGDWVIWAGRDDEAEVKWLGSAGRPGPFALNWRAILYGVLILSLILCLLPVVFWCVTGLYHLSLRLPAPLQPYIGLFWTGLAIVVVIGTLILHPVHLVLFVIGVIREFLQRTLDWHRRRKDKQDPDYLDKAFGEVIAEIEEPAETP